MSFSQNEDDSFKTELRSENFENETLNIENKNLCNESQNFDMEDNCHLLSDDGNVVTKFTTNEIDICDESSFEEEKKILYKKIMIIL